MAKSKTPISSRSLAPLEATEERILSIRGQKVMLDADLAAIYGVTTKRLNEQVKRNIKRFPADFMFQITAEEKAEVVANCDHLHKLKFSPVLPYAFTEHGAVMLASVLNSHIAIDASLGVVRAFNRLRSILATHKDLARRIDELEKKYEAQSQKHEGQFKALFDAIRQLMQPPPAPPRKAIGFHTMIEDKILADKVKESAKNGFLGVKATQKFLSRKRLEAKNE